MEAYEIVKICLISANRQAQEKARQVRSFFCVLTHFYLTKDAIFSEKYPILKERVKHGCTLYSMHIRCNTQTIIRLFDLWDCATVM